MKHILIAAAALSLAGCGAKISASTPQGGVLHAPPAFMQSGLNLANQHCGRYGKGAEINGTGQMLHQVFFACR